MDPKAFSRFRKVIASDKLWWKMFCTITDNEKMCSSVPLMPVKKPFWRPLSMISLSKTNHSSHRAIILWYNLPTPDVKAMGRRRIEVWGGSFGCLKTSFIFASHHESGAVCLSKRVFEKRVARKWWVDGIFLRWRYVIPSSPGEELDDLFMRTLFILTEVIAERSKGVIFSGLEMALLR